MFKKLARGQRNVMASIEHNYALLWSSNMWKSASESSLKCCGEGQGQGGDGQGQGGSAQGGAAQAQVTATTAMAFGDIGGGSGGGDANGGGSGSGGCGECDGDSGRCGSSQWKAPILISIGILWILASVLFGS